MTAPDGKAGKTPDLERLACTGIPSFASVAECEAPAAGPLRFWGSFTTQRVW